MTNSTMLKKPRHYLRDDLLDIGPVVNCSQAIVEHCKFRYVKFSCQKK